MASTGLIEKLGLDLPLPTFIPRRYRPGDLGTWSGHLTFANDLISATQPSLLVELGTHWGESYFGFCQSVLENRVSCLCYGVDNWHGEPHAGYYGEEVFDDVQRYNDTHYRAFSYLLRTSFDQALLQFSAETIDLLHIDGLHTFEAVSHDFRTWLPKVKPGGLILLHDIAVRHVDFGVWRLWEEIQAEFADTFAFHHWWGLGVLRKPDGGKPRPALLDLLFDSPPQVQEKIRRHYALYTFYLENTLRAPENVALPVVGTNTQVQIFPLGLEGYSEEASLARSIEVGSWNKLVFDFPRGIGDGPLRIRPADRACVVEIGEIALVSKASGNLLWSAKDVAALRALTISGSASLLPREDKYLVFSCDGDTRLQLPQLDLEGQGLLVEISLRVDSDFQAVLETLGCQERSNWALLKRLRAADEELADTSKEREQSRFTVQLFPCVAGKYSETSSAIQSIPFEQWKTLAFHFPEGIGNGPLRIHPGDRPGVLKIGKISVILQESAKVIWSAADALDLRALKLSGSVAALPKQDECLLFVYGVDPQLQLPDLDCEGQPVRVEISLRVDRAFDAVFKTLSLQAREIESAQSGTCKPRTGMESAHAESELVQAREETDKARRELRMLEPVMESMRRRLREENSKRIAMQNALETELKGLRDSGARKDLGAEQK